MHLVSGKESMRGWPGTPFFDASATFEMKCDKNPTHRTQTKETLCQQARPSCNFHRFSPNKLCACMAAFNGNTHHLAGSPKATRRKLQNKVSWVAKCGMGWGQRQSGRCYPQLQGNYWEHLLRICKIVCTNGLSTMTMTTIINAKQKT